jgi:ankyrin repeat protein
MKHSKNTILLLTTIFFNCALMSMEQIDHDIAAHIVALCNTQSRKALHCVSHNFHHLCSYNNLSAILDHNKDALTNKEKQYALLWATQRSNYPTVKRLLICGTDPNINNLIHLSPLTIAHKKDDLPMIELLKKYGCLPALTHNAPPTFIIAIYIRDIDTLQQCIDYDEIDPSYQCNSNFMSYNILDIAAHIGDTNILTILFTEPTLCAQINKPDRFGLSPVYRAVKNKHWDVVTFLTSQKNYNVNELNNKGCTQLYLAAEKNDIEAAKFFLADKNIDVNCLFKEQYTPLFNAAMNGYTRMVKLLLTHPNTKEDFTAEATPLYVAAQEGHLNCVKTLCLANHNMINTYFNTTFSTPIAIAVQKGRLEIVKHLLGYEITDTNTIDPIGGTLLHVACKHNHPEIVTLLLKHSPHLINICNNNGDSPLHVAAHEGYYGIVEILANAKNVNMNIINKEDCTPLDVTLNGNGSIINLLITYGGKQTYDDDSL